MSSGLESEVKKETPQEIKKENGINERLPTNFPEGLRVMLIGDDPVLLQHLETLLKELLYQVITYDGAAITLSTLQAEKNNFDIVLCSVHMANMDGFELLKQILAEMDIPVVMMSNEDVNIVMKCVTEGACDCLIKPIERKNLMPIFQHVMRKRMVEHSNDLKSTEASDVSVPLGKSRTSKRKKINVESMNKDGDSIDMSTAKKQRVVWTDELIRKFNAVVEKIGIEKAVPKKILELMNVPWLTRENVASHLQKYRQCNRKQDYPACNPNIPTNQPEQYLASLPHGGELQSLGARGGQLGRPTRNAIDPSLLNNGGFGQDFSNYGMRTGYMAHQSQVRGQLMNSIPPYMVQQMFPNGQNNSVRAPAYNLHNQPQPYYGRDRRINYRAAGFPQNYPSMDNTLNLPNHPMNKMIQHGQSSNMDENCMKWKLQPLASSDLDRSNNAYPPSAFDQYSLLNSQKNDYAHSDSILLSQTNHDHENYTGARLLKPPPNSDTTLEDEESKSDD